MKTVLLLGATSDIGAAIADSFAAAGWSLQLAARRPQDLELQQKDLEVRHTAAVSLHAFDALDTESHASFIDALAPCPDLVVCVFGLLGNEAEAAENREAAERILHTNYTGAVTVLNALVTKFRERGSGGIIGISSVAGERGRASNVHYGSAKAGFTAYLSGLRGALADQDIHVMTVKPGFVATRMTEHMDLPPLLTAQPSEVGSAVIQAWEKNRNTIYVKWFWRWIMLIIQLIPEPIFKKLDL